MKKIIYINLFILCFFISCSKLSDFGDTNVDPAATTIPIIAALLTNVEVGLAGYALDIRGGYYCQYFSETQYSDASLYAKPNTIELFPNYSGPLYDLENIILQNTNKSMSAIAKILKSYIFWVLTDRFGDIPYSESLKKNLTPKFDTQEEIYKSLILTLKAANSEFDPTYIINGDIIYNGNIEKWKKFANSLRVLMALRLSKVYPNSTDYAATEIKSAIADPNGLITSNTDNFQLDYPGGPFKSPWFNLYDGRKDQGQSDVMVSFLSRFSDNRQTVFGSSNLGVPYGWDRAKADAWSGANPTWSRILSDDKRTEKGSVYIVSAANVLLARAEAADRGWTNEDAEALYINGIKLSYTQWDLAEPTTTYLNQTGVKFIESPSIGAKKNIDIIALQQYLAYYPNGHEGWSNYRRTGIPILTPAIDATNISKQIPRRYQYTQYEYSTNSIKLKEAISRLEGGDSQDSRVWWDKK